VIDHRLSIAVAVSIVGHFVFAEAVSTLPPLPPPELDHRVTVRLVSPPIEPPPPEPIKPPEPIIAPEHVIPSKTPRPVTPRTVVPTVADPLPTTTPIDSHAVVAPPASGPPVFGVSMTSTSTAGAGPVMPVGNSTDPNAGRAPAAAVQGQAPAPVAAYEVTKMPLPQGRCAGKYTDAAKAAGIEGTVVLDLIVDEHGRARSIVVVTGLDHGLTEAAIAALKDCRFQPGEKDGAPVAVKVRGFKIRFVMQVAP
jgi:periplasmic protein TonB